MNQEPLIIRKKPSIVASKVERRRGSREGSFTFIWDLRRTGRPKPDVLQLLGIGM